MEPDYIATLAQLLPDRIRYRPPSDEEDECVSVKLDGIPVTLTADLQGGFTTADSGVMLAWILQECELREWFPGVQRVQDGEEQAEWIAGIWPKRGHLSTPGPSALDALSKAFLEAVQAHQDV